MFIETEATPNPDTLKFLPGRPVLGSRPPVDLHADSANRAQSPLADALLMIPGVTGVFMGQDFVTIRRDPAIDWVQLKPPVLGTIMEHYMAGRPVLLESSAGPAGEPSPEADADADAESGPGASIIVQIKDLLDTRVRPAVAQDGGDITFHAFRDGIVYLHMQGSCAGCPSSTLTLKSGIERLLTHFIPEVQGVEAVQ